MAIPLPNSSSSFVDGQLGSSTGTAERTVIIIGASTGGTAAAGSFSSFSPSGVGLIPAAIGVGPAADQATHSLQESGQPVIVYKPTLSVAGTNSAVTQTGAGPLPTLSQAPNDATEVSIKITLGGIVGTSQFIYSLDGEETWSETYATAATFLLPNNTLVTFTAGTYVLNEVYRFTTTAPMMNTTNLGDALDAVIASVYDPYFVQIVGQAADAAATATLAALLATKITAARTARKMFAITFESPAVDKAGLITAMSSYVCEDAIGFAGFAEIINARSGLIQKRSSGRVLGPRLQRNPRSIHMLRDKANSKIDPLPSVFKLVPDGAAASTGYHDEEKTPGLNAARFCALRTIVGKPGFYPTNGLTFAANGSDWQQVMYRMIVLEVARAWYGYSVEQLGLKVNVNQNTGFIDGRVADSLQSEGERAIGAALGTDIQAVRVIVNRADNLSSDPTLRATIRILVGAYILTISADIGVAASLPVAA